MSQDYIKILGVNINILTKQQALERVKGFLNSQKQNKIFTPNPEMLVDASKDEYFREVLNSGDLNICDGKGLSLVAKTKKIPGVDFMLDICTLAEKKNKSIYLLGSGNDEVIEKTAEKLKKRFSNLKIVGINKGVKIERSKDYKIDYDKEKNDEITHDIIMSAPDILFVAFGHGKQEKWIDKNLKQLPSVKIAMGVGGSFDFISGKVKRAPKWMRKLGLEWLYRLFRQPSRLPRIFKATILFLYYYLKNKK